MLTRVLWPVLRAGLLPVRSGLSFCVLIACTAAALPAAAVDGQPSSLQALVDSGDYDRAVESLWLNGRDSRTAGRHEAASSHGPASAMTRLIAAVEQADLADEPLWQALLHYKGRAGDVVSEVDSSHFFLAAHGKTDPRAELRATVAALFAQQAKPPLRLTPYCRFVARRVWLEQRLGDLATLLPPQVCTEFEQYRQFLQAEVLTLVFPSAYPNNPSSAFGHTLMRIDRRDQTAESRLLNMSINFAAEVPPGVSSAEYAIKGLAGGFSGRYRLLPYHLKLREYGQIQNRDTWEYELDLEPEQVDLMLRHTYEMLIAEFDYYFFSENCSYHLLSLLDVLYPDEPLTDEFGLWTIPTDTIRLLEQRGIAGHARFVPSSIRTLRQRREALPPADRPLASAALSQGLPGVQKRLGTLSDDRQAAVLDLLSDYLRYERLQVDTAATAMSEEERAVLSHRSRLPVRSETPVVPTPAASPDQGHRTARLALGRRAVRKGSGLVELGVRPAYHDVRDPSLAYGNKNAIELLNVVVGHDLERGRTFLRKVTLLDIESIEPRDELFKPVAWHTRLRWERADPAASHRFTFNVGAGAAFQASDGAPITFVLLESDLIDDPSFDRRAGLQLGLGGGVHWEPLNGLRTGLEFDFRRRIGEPHEESRAEAWLSVALGSQWALVLDGSSSKRSNQAVDHAAGAELRYYF